MVNSTIVRKIELISLVNQGIPAISRLAQFQSDESKELLTSHGIFDLDELLSLRGRHIEASRQHELYLLRGTAPRDTYQHSDLAFAVASGRIVMAKEAKRMIAVDAALLFELAKRPEYLLVSRTADPPYCHVSGAPGLDYAQLGRAKAAEAANFRLSSATIEK